MYDLDVTFASLVSSERAHHMRARFTSFVLSYISIGRCTDYRLFLARCLLFAATRCDCSPLFLTVRRHVEGEITCKCVDFALREPYQAVCFGLDAVKRYSGETVDVGFESDQDAFWIHLTGEPYDV